MKPRDLYFATQHQAAQIVAALTLGCPVDSVVPAANFEDLSICFDVASMEDIESVAAAGFEMERILGRLEEQAWARSESDRVGMARQYADHTGITLDAKAIDERFLRGAAASRAIIEHVQTRNAINDLAEALSDAYDMGKSLLSREEIHNLARLSLAHGQ